MNEIKFFKKDCHFTCEAGSELNGIIRNRKINHCEEVLKWSLNVLALLIIYFNERQKPVQIR